MSLLLELIARVTDIQMEGEKEKKRKVGRKEKKERQEAIRVEIHEKQHCFPWLVLGNRGYMTHTY